MQPSSWAITATVVGVSILLLSGITYDIVNQPYPSFYTGEKFYFLYPSLGEQFLFDTVIAGFLFTGGLIGLLSLHRSARHAYNPRQAYMMMTIGVSLTLISWALLEYLIIFVKTGA
jgi:hypothetical protein